MKRNEPRLRKTGALVAPFALLVLTACVADGPQPAPPFAPPFPPPSAGACDPGWAESLIGGRTISDPQARRETGAFEVRQIGPNDPTTRDFRPDRVTITNDYRVGRILDAGCF